MRLSRFENADLRSSRSPSSPSAPSLVLRPPVERDLRSLAVLAMQVFLDTYALTGIRQAIADEALRAFSVDAFAALLAREDTLIVLAERQYHLIGFSQVTLGAGQELVRTAAPAELDRLYIQAPFARKGVGSRLLARAEQDAAQRGATALWLTAWEHNARARQFYRKHRYADAGTTFFRMDDERHENRVLVKALTEKGPGVV